MRQLGYMAKKQPTTEPGKIYSLRMPLSLLEALAEIADDEDRSVAWLIRRAVRDFIEEHGR